MEQHAERHRGKGEQPWRCVRAKRENKKPDRSPENGQSCVGKTRVLTGPAPFLSPALLEATAVFGERAHHSHELSFSRGADVGRAVTISGGRRFGWAVIL